MGIAKVIMLGIFCVFMGAFSMWLWTRADVADYKERYTKAVAEKKALTKAYNKRLDELRGLVGDAVDIPSLGLDDPISGVMEPLRTCEDHCEVITDEYC